MHNCGISFVASHTHGHNSQFSVLLKKRLGTASKTLKGLDPRVHPGWRLISVCGCAAQAQLGRELQSRERRMERGERRARGFSERTRRPRGSRGTGKLSTFLSFCSYCTLCTLSGASIFPHRTPPPRGVPFQVAEPCIAWEL